MKLYDILKNIGLFSNDIKIRVKNNQIKFGGEVVTSNIELDINSNFICDGHEFFCNWCYENQKGYTYEDIYIHSVLCGGAVNLFGDLSGELSNIEFINLFKDFYILQVAKKQYYVLMKA